MLLKFPQPRLPGEDEAVYPVIECEITMKDGTISRFPACCFHALTEEDDEGLAGMGLAIVGNLCKLMREWELALADGEIQGPLPTASLWLRMDAWQRDADRIPLPWPGMPDDNPILPFRPEELPFESEMFLEEGKFKKRIDRLLLLARIRDTWVPYLKTKLMRVA